MTVRLALLALALGVAVGAAISWERSSVAEQPSVSLGLASQEGIQHPVGWSVVRIRPLPLFHAGVAQLAEQHIRNVQVAGSMPVSSANLAPLSAGSSVVHAVSDTQLSSFPEPVGMADLQTANSAPEPTPDAHGEAVIATPDGHVIDAPREFAATYLSTMFQEHGWQCVGDRLEVVDGRPYHILGAMQIMWDGSTAPLAEKLGLTYQEVAEACWANLTLAVAMWEQTRTWMRRWPQTVPQYRSEGGDDGSGY